MKCLLLFFRLELTTVDVSSVNESSLNAVIDTLDHHVHKVRCNVERNINYNYCEKTEFREVINL